jgi:cytochrome c biogenesis factor
MLSMTVSLSLFAVVMLASLMGTITPLVLNQLKINPAVASGPFITTTNDILGYGVYFFLAYKTPGLLQKRGHGSTALPGLDITMSTTVSRQETRGRNQLSVRPQGEGAHVIRGTGKTQLTPK